MGTIERHCQTAEPVADRNGKDRAFQSGREAAARRGLGGNVERAVSAGGLDDRVIWVKCLCCRIIPSLIGCAALKSSVIFPKHTGGSKADSLVHSLNQMRFYFERGFRIQDRLAETHARSNSAIIK